ncbi:MAG: GNAT family N-acetyltransferase [Chloroflexi bacterium]|nr:GNAT family N-acetyltransferase [Chloroflexota bacterium]
MSTEIRPVAPGEREAFHDIVAYVFAISRADLEFHRTSGFDAYYGRMGTVGAFVDGELATTLAWHRVRIAFNGQMVDCGAVTNVGTLPSFRRRGLLRQVMTRTLSDLRDEGRPVAMLWASFGAIYQRFGYGAASSYVAFRYDPRGVGLREPREYAGTVRLVRPGAAQSVMQRLYQRHLEGRTLLIERTESWWEHALADIARHEHRSHVGVALDASEEPRGYVLYRTAEDQHKDFEPGGDQSLEVRDFVALDLDTRVALWEFIRAHDLVKQVKFTHATEDEPIVDMLLEPRELRRATGDGMWLRIVDVAAALGGRGYDEDGAVTLSVRDDVCPWNDGAYRLSVDGGVARVERIEGAGELAMPVAALATLISGYRSATQLARAGRVEGSPDAPHRADTLFATAYRPHVMDGF